MTIIGLYIFLLIWIILIADKSDDNYSKFASYLIIFSVGISNYLALSLAKELIPYRVFSYDWLTFIPFKIVFWKWVYTCLIIITLIIANLFIYRRFCKFRLKFGKLLGVNIFTIILFSTITLNCVNPFWDSYTFSKKPYCLLDSSPLFNRVSEIKLFFGVDTYSSDNLSFDNHKITRNDWMHNYGFDFPKTYSGLDKPTYFLDEKEKIAMWESYCMFYPTAICKGYKPIENESKNINFFLWGLFVLAYLTEVFLMSISKAMITSLILLGLFFFRTEYFIEN